MPCLPMRYFRAIANVSFACSCCSCSSRGGGQRSACCSTVGCKARAHCICLLPSDVMYVCMYVPVLYLCDGFALHTRTLVLFTGLTCLPRSSCCLRSLPLLRPLSGTGCLRNGAVWTLRRGVCDGQSGGAGAGTAAARQTCHSFVCGARLERRFQCSGLPGSATSHDCVKTLLQLVLAVE
jgi:hypothetical protein